MLTRRLDPFVGAFRLHSDFFGPSFLQKMNHSRPEDFQPAVDILETDDAFIFRADLPGVKKEDLKIEVEKDVLTIAGSRTKAEASEGDSQWRTESYSGAFSRGFRLPTTVDTSSIHAELEDGILTVRIGLKEEVKPVHVEID
jgi:HSP20 family protein